MKSYNPLKITASKKMIKINLKKSKNKIERNKFRNKLLTKNNHQIRVNQFKYSKNKTKSKRINKKDINL